MVMLKFDTDAVSKRAHCFRTALVSETELGLAASDLNRMTTGTSITGEYNYGYIVAALSARTDSGNTDAAYADAGAEVTSGGAHAFLHVTAITMGGYANCLIKLRDSADGDAHADNVAFTAVTAIGSEYKATAAAVGRYPSVSWLWQGGSPTSGHSITFTVAYARD
jgi:hypothetical protein